MSLPGLGELAAVGTALCWTISALCFTAASRRVGSLTVNIVRLAMALVLLALYGRLMRGHWLPTDAPASAWWWLGLSGFVGFFVGDLCGFRALVLIGPRLTTLLMTLAPPVAALMGILMLDQHLSALNWLGMAVTIAGVAWVALEQHPEGDAAPHRVSAWGLTLGVLGAVGQAAGLVFSKLGMDPEAGGVPYDPFAATQIRALVGFAGFAALLAALRWYPKLWDSLTHPSAMGFTALGALVGPFLGVSLLLLAVQRIPAGIAQALVAPVPVLILPFVILFHKERVSPRAAVGACVAVAGLAMLLLTTS